MSGKGRTWCFATRSCEGAVHNTGNSGDNGCSLKMRLSLLTRIPDDSFIIES